jgi:hypothetical protein
MCKPAAAHRFFKEGVLDDSKIPYGGETEPKSATEPLIYKKMAA